MYWQMLASDGSEYVQQCTHILCANDSVCVCVCVGGGGGQLHLGIKVHTVLTMLVHESSSCPLQKCMREP